jgi:ATP-dependent DNA helicase RecG
MNSPVDRNPHDQLTRPVQFAKGVGPKRAEILGKLGIRTAADLLFFFPRKYEDYSTLTSVDTFVENQPVCLVCVVDYIEQHETASGKKILYVLVESGGKFVRAIWFNQPYMSTHFSQGQRLVLRGKPRLNGMRWELVHPRVHWLKAGEDPSAESLQPVYRLTDGINQPALRGIIQQSVDELAPLVEDVFDQSHLECFGLCTIEEALRWIHSPANEEQMQQARTRLVFQELLLLQLALAIKKNQTTTRRAAPCLPINARIMSRIKRLFPFELSAQQELALEQITDDMAKPHPMNRLLHGEVGSGKTVVAFSAMMLAAAHGYRSILMSPSELLSQQHFRNLSQLLKNSRVRVALWTGSVSGAQRRETEEALAAGDIDIVIGTQAIVQSNLEIPNLGLVVIDEQHKFGVKQRAGLKLSGVDPHYLVMTATPIPRTIAMTAFGDLDITTLTRDATRQGEVNTYVGSEITRESWYEFVKKKLREGRQAYFIAPLVGGDDQDKWSSVERVYESLSNGAFEEFRLDLLHGRQSPEEKEASMLAFERGHTQMLIATNVIEVGIDVENATVATIDSAERFGLAQLHQMRGRVGRGRHPGYVCVFPSGDDENAMERLNLFEKVADGFELAEADLRLRGPGDFFGTRQHGLPPLRIADLIADTEILHRTREIAAGLIAEDAELSAACWKKMKSMIKNRYSKALQLADVG